MANLTKKSILFAMAVVASFCVYGTARAESVLPAITLDNHPAPMFYEASFMPGDEQTRYAAIDNTAADSTEQPIIARAVYTGGIAAGTDDLSRVLTVVVRDKAGNDVYGGSKGAKTLYQMFGDGNIALSAVAAGSTEKYAFVIGFPSSSGDEWQTRGTLFDLTVCSTKDPDCVGGGSGDDSGGDDDSTGDDSGSDDDDAAHPSTRTYGAGSGGQYALTIKNVRAANIADSSAAILWDTNLPATSQVIFSSEGQSHTFKTDSAPYGYASFTPDPEDGDWKKAHTVALTGLARCTKYYYRVISYRTKGRETISYPEMSFTTRCEQVQGWTGEAENINGTENGVIGGTSAEAEGTAGQVKGESTEAPDELSLGNELEAAKTPETDSGSAAGSDACAGKLPWWLLLLSAAITAIIGFANWKNGAKTENSAAKDYLRKSALLWLAAAIVLIILAAAIFAMDFICFDMWIALVIFALFVLGFWLDRHNSGKVR